MSELSNWSRSLTKAIRAPSGDQTGSWSDGRCGLPGGVSVRFTGLEPSASITHTSESPARSLAKAILPLMPAKAKRASGSGAPLGRGWSTQAAEATAAAMSSLTDLVVTVLSFAVAGGFTSPASRGRSFREAEVQLLWPPRNRMNGVRRDERTVSTYSYAKTHLDPTRPVDTHDPTRAHLTRLTHAVDYRPQTLPAAPPDNP